MVSANPIAHIAFVEGSGSCTRRLQCETLGNFTVLVRLEGLDPPYIAKDPGALNRDGFRFNVRIFPDQRPAASLKIEDVFVGHPGMTIQSLDWPFAPKNGPTNASIEVQSKSRAARGHTHHNIRPPNAQPN
jgi:hypothetical protein